jgi:hypothetical protein
MILFGTHQGKINVGSVIVHNGLAVWFCKPTTPLKSNDKLSKAYKLYRLLYAGRS